MKMENKALASTAKYKYRLGKITQAEAIDAIMPFIVEYNEKVKKIAKKYNQKPKFISALSFLR